jgi:DNA-3-methyladenine glycosylase
MIINFNMNKILNQKFFNRNTLEVAEELIGKYLVIKKGNINKSAMIVEVEAYDGPEDKACHAHKGKTERNKVMFGPPGYWYVYLVYGMYWMLNIVTDSKDYPGAVLIRGVENIDGPGKLTKSMEITDYFNNKPAEKSTGLWIENRGEVIEKNRIEQTPRIGVEYASEWKNKLYRFVLINKLR